MGGDRMSIESDVFERHQPDGKRCEAYGFQRAGDVWRLERTFLDGAFRAAVTIDAVGRVTGEVIDTMTDEEYLPLRLKNPAGSYVYGVRHAYEELLRGIAEACFVRVPFGAGEPHLHESSRNVGRCAGVSVEGKGVCDKRRVPPFGDAEMVRPHYAGDVDEARVGAGGARGNPQREGY